MQGAGAIPPPYLFGVVKMTRISKAMLNSKLADLNAALDLPQDPYAPERDARGNLVANAGTFVLDWAYGGVQLCRMCAGGGQSNVSGRGTTRECYTFISAMLAGIYAARKADKAGARLDVESAFFAGFSEGSDGGWVEGDPAPAFAQYLADRAGAV